MNTDLDVNLDTNNIQSMDFPEIPSGDYLCLVQSIEKDIDNKKQAPYFKIKLQILEGPYANQKLFDNWKGIVPQTEGVFGETTKYSASRLKSMSEALGHQGRVPNLGTFINQQVMVKAVLKNGYTNVSSYSPAYAASGAMANSQQGAPAGVGNNTMGNNPVPRHQNRQPQDQNRQPQSAAW